MLLRSISKHVKDQNWFAVVLDFFIVVAGILIAFQITNWNGDRQQYHQQQLTESRLISDFQTLDVALTDAVARHENVIVVLDTLQVAINRGFAHEDEDGAIKLALRMGRSYPTFIRNSTTYKELVSSGKLNLIKDESLRVALVQYDERAQNSLFNLEQIRNSMDANYIYLMKHAKLEPIDKNNIRIRSVMTYDINAMAQDEKFRSDLEILIVYQTWIHSNLVNQQLRVIAVRSAMEGTNK